MVVVYETYLTDTLVLQSLDNDFRDLVDRHI